MEITISFNPKPHQRELINYFRKGGRRAVACWHRKAGKDRTATFIESERAFERVGLYWHALPKYEDARRVIWDAITPDGKRLIDLNFPPQVIRKKLDHEMKIELINGSIWQPVGADSFDSLVGANPVHATLSEFALMHPQAWNFIRPALAANNGTAMFISTPRGYNHFHQIYQYAKTDPSWFCSTVSAEESGMLSADVLAEERKTMPDELVRQEYYCDFSAANVGSILGRYVEQAEKDGRISDEVEYDPEGAPIEISSDIGRTDTSAWWFWQPQVGGFNLVDYDEDSGLDAQEWIDRLQKLLEGRRLKMIWLPHDAKAKTFGASHSPVEQFLKAFGHGKVGISPLTKKEHSINAGRVVMRRCRFNATRCAPGLDGLRAWAYKYDEERKTYSRDPVHDWASHPADGFCEGAKIMQERIIEVPKPVEPIRGLIVGPENKVSLNEMWKFHDQSTRRGERI